MDIATRLRSFMEYTKLTPSQFADTCRIPRPTLSQIIGGRNKKISDEIIGKIHTQFPNLNILWLMFGEGQMLHNAAEIVAGDNNAQIIENSGLFAQFQQDEAEDSNPTPQTATIEKHVDEDIQIGAPKTSAVTPTPTALNDIIAPELKKTAEGICSAGKRIKLIMVFYTDNSFETYEPSKI